MHLAKRDGSVNPMRASGIALAGAQSTFQSWRDGVSPDPDNDGILMAEEVAGLNLDGTWLVSLSACETGVGEARSGEGVFGLRRAFMMAGAQNLLMTLWPVNDSTTTDIMSDFYKKCLASGNPTRSLAETQRDWLCKLRKEKGLLAAVGDAGAFVMTSPGINARNFPEE
jgi:CHAT domain-containing protein